METNKLPKSGMAIASLILGIMSFVIMPIVSDISVLPGIIAIILGIAALFQVSKRRFGGKGLAISGIVLGCWVLIFLNISLPGRPRYTDYIYYRNPAWLSNEKIVFVKTTNHRNNQYDWISSASDSMQDSIKDEIQICSMDIDGSDEKVIKNIVINYTFPSRTMRWEDKTFEGVTGISYISVNCKRQLIAFSVNCFDKRALYLMNFDGTNIREITYDGYEPKLSPDGTKILYGTARNYVNPKHESIKKDLRSEEWHRVSNLRDYYIYEDTLWLMDADGGNKEKIVSDNRIYTFAWHPDGERIIYVNDKDMKKYIVSLSDKSKEEFSLLPREQISEGAKIIVVGRGIYYDPSSLFLKLKNIPSEAQFSPDGTRLVGGPMGNINAAIGVVNTDGIWLRALKIDSKVDY